MLGDHASDKTHIGVDVVGGDVTPQVALLWVERFFDVQRQVWAFFEWFKKCFKIKFSFSFNETSPKIDRTRCSTRLLCSMSTVDDVTGWPVWHSVSRGKAVSAAYRLCSFGGRIWSFRFKNRKLLNSKTYNRSGLAKPGGKIQVECIWV